MDGVAGMELEPNADTVEAGDDYLPVKGPSVVVHGGALGGP